VEPAALWLGIVTAVLGAAVALYGVVILLTGRAVRGDRRSFPGTRQAGMYYLCFGAALVTLVSSILGNLHHQRVLAVAGLVGTLVLAALALRYRPRRNRRT
jgi:hypothetical protein